MLFHNSHREVLVVEKNAHKTKRSRIKVQDVWKSSRYFLIGVSLLFFLPSGLYLLFKGEVLIGLPRLIQSATLPLIVRGRNCKIEFPLLMLLYLSRSLLGYHLEIGLSVFALVLIGALIKELRGRDEAR